MLILSRVCASFRNAAGQILFEVTPPMLNTFQEAPEEIQTDPLFGLLVAERSLEAVVSAAERRALENDPLKNTDRTGKRIPTAPDAPQTGTPSAPTPTMPADSASAAAFAASDPQSPESALPSDAESIPETPLDSALEAAASAKRAGRPKK